MIGAEPAVVRAAPPHRRVEDTRHLRRLDEDLAAAPVVSTSSAISTRSEPCAGQRLSMKTAPFSNTIFPSTLR